jgi:polysaccharide biosynthesis/export protein
MRFSSLMKAVALTTVSQISIARSFRLKLFLLLGFGLVGFLVPAGSMRVAAQQNLETPAATRIASPVPSSDDTRYRIGPGDVLAILVTKAPELSLEAVRVDQRGMIRIPMIREGVLAACQTESELATHIATLYLEYKNNPSVDVFVKEFQSQPVAVIGEVDKPGQFRLQRRVRMLELVSLAGGPTNKAGRVINLIHAGGTNICPNDPAANSVASDAQALTVFRLNDTLKGMESANPFVQPGDIISLPEADQVFVVGYVIQPKAIPLKDKAITVSQAIAMAGGPQRDASTSHVRIIRQRGDGVNKEEIPVNLSAIMKQKAADIPLLPNDIVEVGASTSKTLLNILTGTIPGVLTNGVIRAVP